MEIGPRRQRILASSGALAVMQWCRMHPNLTALFAYAIIALCANIPVFPGDPSRLNTTTTYDITQSTWFLAYTPYALIHGQNLFYTNLVNYPVGVNLAQNTEMPLLGLLASPLTLLVSPVASLNLLRWLAFCLSAFSCFWVFRRFVKWTPAAFIGGLLYGFSPYMVTQGSLHLNLAFVPFPPIIFYLLYEICVIQRLPARRAGLLCGVSIVAQFFISQEVLATTAVIACVAAVILALLCVHDVIPRLRHIATSAVYALVLVLPALSYPVWFMVHGAAHYSGPAQGFVNIFNADLLGPIVPTYAQLLAPKHLAAIGSGFVAGPSDLSENGSYLGLPLILATAYLVARFWRRLWPIYIALLASAAFVLSLGSTLIVGGRVIALPFHLPFQKISHLPLLENLLPVRFSLYVVFFVALIIALGIDWIHDERVALGRRVLWVKRASGGAPLRQGFGWTFGALCVLSLLPAFPYRSYHVHINWSESRQGLSIIPTGTRVLTYPYTTAFQDSPMLWQAVSAMRFPVFGSYALIPSSNGSASLMPSLLSPLTVPAMLEDSVTPNPVPGEPDLVATTSTMIARTISNVSDRTRFIRHAGATDLHATVDSVNLGQHLMVVWVRRLNPILVKITPSTRFINANGRRATLSSLRPRNRVIVTGYTTTGTINPTTTALLRAFIVIHRVQAVVVDLGLRDSGTIAHWFRLALGPPSRAGAGGEIWLNASAKAVRQRPRMFHSRHPVAIASRSQHRARTLSRA